MLTFNRYLLVMTLLFLTTTLALAATGEDRLGLYFALFLMESLILTLFFAHLNPRARRGLHLITVGLLAGFGVIILDRVLVIILGVELL